MNQNLHVHIPTPGDHYSPRTGSAVITVIREMTRCHIAAGGQAQVLVAPGTWDGFDDGLRREVPFRRLGTPSKAAKIIDGTLGGLLGRRILSGRPYIDAANTLGRDFDGIAFVHNEPSGVEPIARRCPKAKVCLWVHNDLFRTYTHRQASRVIGCSYRIVCVSDFIGSCVRAKAGENSRIVTVLNGVDIEKFVPANPRLRNDPPVILYLGRMIPDKGPDILLRAAIELKRDGIQFKVRMVGSSNFNAADKLTAYEIDLRELAKQLGDSVEIHPFRPREEVVAEYQAADILCVPSNWDEPLGLVVAEGLACGLAVVASRRGGIPELGGTSVRYFDPPDTKALAGCLAEELTACEDSERGKHQRAAAEQNTWPILHQKLALTLANYSSTATSV